MRAAVVSRSVDIKAELAEDGVVVVASVDCASEAASRK